MEERRRGGGREEEEDFRVGEQAVSTLFLIRKQVYFIKVKMEENITHKNINGV